MSAGLAKQKVPRIQETLKQVRELTGGYDLSFLAEMPLQEAKAWLRALPGVGPKTTAIVLCFALGMPAMAVDTHVHRVSKRLGLIGPKVSAEKAHDVLESLVPTEDVYAFHVALISHGTTGVQGPAAAVRRLRPSRRMPRSAGIAGCGTAVLRAHVGHGRRQSARACAG